MLAISIVGSFAFISCLLLTRLLIIKADAIGMIDAPNHRSSHDKPIPKGGGLGFFTVFVLALLVIRFFKPDYNSITSALLFGGPLVFLVGWMDDRFHIRPLFRLLIQLVVAGTIFGLVTQWFRLEMSISFLPNIFWVNALFCVLFISWFINLYNFMDGSNGMAAGGGVVGSLLLAVICLDHGAPEFALIYCLLAYTLSGFLYYNWGVAKIFMGDTGAYFLGFVFATLALESKIHANISFYSHIIIFGFFIMDASYTLLVRGLRGAHVFAGHQQFAFHKLIAKGWSHKKVVTFYLMTMVLWLFPLANLASIYDGFGVPIVIIAYLPLFIFQVYQRAGLE